MKTNIKLFLTLFFCLIYFPDLTTFRILPKNRPVTVSKLKKTQSRQNNPKNKIKKSRFTSFDDSLQPARELIKKAFKTTKISKKNNHQKIIRPWKAPIQATTQLKNKNRVPERKLRLVKPKTKKRSGKNQNSRFDNLFQIEYKNIKNQKILKEIKDKLSLRAKGVSKELRTLIRERKLIDMVLNIRKNAKKKKLQIKNVMIGKNLKKMESGRKLFKNVQKYLNTPNLKRKLRSILKSIKRARKKAKRLALKKKKKKNLASSKNNISNPNFPSNQPRKMPLSAISQMKNKVPGAGGAGAGSGNLMKFNFLPGFAGMPFPPFMMNGPHFHPPLNVTVNSLPNPNPRAQLNPKEIEEENVKTQLNALHPIADKLDHVLREIDSIGKESSVNLDDKYQRVINLNS